MSQKMECKATFASCGMSAEDAQTCEDCCNAQALPPGTLLNLLQQLMKNGPAIFAQVMALLALFKNPPPAPPAA